jgi:hypothetical protein
MAVKLSALRAGLPFDPRKTPGTYFCYRLGKPQGHSAAGKIRSTEKNPMTSYRTIPKMSHIEKKLCYISPSCKVILNRYEKKPNLFDSL